MTSEKSREIFAKNLDYYMHRKGVDRNKLCEDLNFKYTTVRDWMKGISYPRIGKIEILANYFGIEKSDLIEDKTNKPVQTIDLTNLRERVVMFDGKPLSDNDVEKIEAIIKLSLGVGNSEDK
ncbi:helix-turn-helix domain-containing protein [Streptococcus uberis]|uniref:helix-turn-helix domain-containing protein n=1 Tax=Streptococcus uberis TaxID=1349 RepID=UPI001939EFF4|nr:helix-turn-helix domain-containing protein [Streptococcus uberis]